MKPLSGSTRFDVSQAQGKTAAEVAAMAGTSEDTAGAFPEDGAAMSAEDRRAMVDIMNGGTGDIPPPPPVLKSHQELVLDVVTSSAPHCEVVALTTLLDEAFERGCRQAGATRDELVAARARLVDAEARRKHEVAALLSDPQEMPAVRRKLGELAAMVRVHESRAEYAEKKVHELEGAQLARVDDHPGGREDTTSAELAFANGQIAALHETIVKLQGENAALLQRIEDLTQVANRRAPVVRRRRKRV